MASSAKAVAVNAGISTSARTSARAAPLILFTKQFLIAIFLLSPFSAAGPFGHSRIPRSDSAKGYSNKITT